MIVGFDGTILREPRTGIGYYTYFLIQHLLADEEGVQARIYDGLRMKPAEMAVLQDQPEAISAGEGVGSRLAAQFRRSSTARMAWRAFKSAGFRRAARGLDLFHATNYLPPARLSIPVLPLIHDVSHIRHPEWHPIERVRWLDRRADEFRSAPLIHTVSHFSAAEIAATLSVPRENIHVTYPGVNPVYRDELPGDRAVLKEAASEPGRFFLCVGTLEPRKNLATAIAAFARLDKAMQERFPLLVVGPPGWGDLALPAASERLRRRGVLRFLGYVDEGRMRTLYRECAAFLFPSSYEGFGMPVSEAMALGARPIVASGGAPEEVASPHGLALPAMDDAAWASAMIQAVEEDWYGDRQLREKLRAASMKFTWAGNARDTMAIYEKLLLETTGAPR